MNEGKRQCERDMEETRSGGGKVKKKVRSVAKMVALV
jgi:hypothetical protein